MAQKFPTRWEGQPPESAPVVLTFLVRRASALDEVALVFGGSRSDAARLLWRFRYWRKKCPLSSRTLFPRLPHYGVTLNWLSRCMVTLQISLNENPHPGKHPRRRRWYKFYPPVLARVYQNWT